MSKRRTRHSVLDRSESCGNHTQRKVGAWPTPLSVRPTTEPCRHSMEVRGNFIKHRGWYGFNSSILHASLIQINVEWNWSTGRENMGDYYIHYALESNKLMQLTSWAQALKTIICIVVVIWRAFDCSDTMIGLWKLSSLEPCDMRYSSCCLQFVAFSTHLCEGCQTWTRVTLPAFWKEPAPAQVRLLLLAAFLSFWQE